ncbi:MAG: lysine exporter LysO family protein [Caldisphaera sp.]
MGKRTNEILPPLLIFLLGLIIGKIIKINALIVENIAITWLYILIGLIGIEVGVSGKEIIRSAINGIKDGLKLTISVLIGDIIAALILYKVLNENIKYAIIISLGSGWYSLTGPFLSIYNPYFGIIGFISNLLREVYTLSLFPLLYQYFDNSSIAMGGATTMDTTLGIIIRYSGLKNGSSALIQGLIITIILPILFPLIIGLH